jgi:predicted regulator of Ras-like GTPase activity (Roadblock/LC7/MglB family)
VIGAFQALLAPLARQRGVLGCLVVEEADGIVIDAAARDGVAADAVAALAASLYRRARHASHAAGFGAVRVVRLEAEHGHVLAAGRGDLVVVALAEPAANLGLVRLAILRCVEGLS